MTDYERGYNDGHQDGYAKGRAAGIASEREVKKKYPDPGESQSNGWVAVTEALTEAFPEIEDETTRVYVIRDMTGEIVGVMAQE